MASSTRGRGDVKGFFRQTKKTSGRIAKKPAPSLKSKGKISSSPNHPATIGSVVVQPAALMSGGGFLDLDDGYDEKEEVLRGFDMNMAYGPCVGMSRIARWERANRLGFNPPMEVERLLKDAKVPPHCLWDARV